MTITSGTSVLPLQCGHGEFAVENEKSFESTPTDAYDASMRPRRIRRGERGAASRRGAGGRPGFNAATANSPWRTIPVTSTNPFSFMLQCGHGEFAVENTTNIQRDVCGCTCRDFLCTVLDNPSISHLGRALKTVDYCVPRGRAWLSGGPVE